MAARVDVGELTAEFMSLSDRVFKYLASHPDGTRLAEIEEEFGIQRNLSARVVQRLVNEGKGQKRALSYFAI